MNTSTPGHIHMREGVIPFTVDHVYPGDIEGFLSLIEMDAGDPAQIKNIVSVTQKSVRELAHARGIRTIDEALNMLLKNPIVIGEGEDGRNRVRAIIENPPKENHSQEE